MQRLYWIHLKPSLQLLLLERQWWSWRHCSRWYVHNAEVASLCYLLSTCQALFQYQSHQMHVHHTQSPADMQTHSTIAWESNRLIGKDNPERKHSKLSPSSWQWWSSDGNCILTSPWQCSYWYFHMVQTGRWDWVHWATGFVCRKKKKERIRNECHEREEGNAYEWHWKRCLDYERKDDARRGCNLLSNGAQWSQHRRCIADDKVCTDWFLMDRQVGVDKRHNLQSETATRSSKKKEHLL